MYNTMKLVTYKDVIPASNAVIYRFRGLNIVLLMDANYADGLCDFEREKRLIMNIVTVHNYRGCERNTRH